MFKKGKRSDRAAYFAAARAKVGTLSGKTFGGLPDCALGIHHGTTFKVMIYVGHTLVAEGRGADLAAAEHDAMLQCDYSPEGLRERCATFECEEVRS